MRTTTIFLVLLLLAVGMFWILQPTGSGQDPYAIGDPDLLRAEEEGVHPDPVDQTGLEEEGNEFASSGREDLSEQAPVAVAGRKAAAAGLSLQLVDVQGKPIQDASVTVELEDRGQFHFRPFGNPGAQQQIESYSAEPSSNGWLRFRKLPSGEDLRLKVSGRYWVPRSLQLAPLAPGENRELGALTLEGGVVFGGEVLDSNGHPVAGATVALKEGGGTGFGLSLVSIGGESPENRGRTTKTDREGAFLLEGVAPGNYRLEVVAQGWTPLTQSQTVKAQPLDQRVSLRLERGLSVQGQVRNADGKAIPDAKVVLLESRGFSRMQWTYSRILESGMPVDPHGGFELGGMDAGKGYVVGAAAPEFGLGFSKAVVPGQQAVVELKPVVNLTGTVLDSADQPVADAEVQLKIAKQKQRHYFWNPTANTDANGQFDLPELTPGEYRMEVSSAMGVAVIEELKVESGMDPLEIQVEGEGLLLCRLVNDQGHALTGIDVQLAPKGGQSQSVMRFDFSGDSGQIEGEWKKRTRRTTTDAQGEAYFYGVPPGDWEFTTKPAGHSNVRHPIQRTEAKKQEELITTYREAILQVQVVDILGGSVPRSKVRVSVVDGPKMAGPSIRSTDEWGLASWTGLAPARYRFRVEDSSSGLQFDVMDPSSSANPPEGGPEWRETLVEAGTIQKETWILADKALPRVRVLKMGQPLAGAVVELKKKQEDGSTSFSFGGGSEGVRTGPDGWAELPPKTPGSYRLKARSAPGRPATEQDWDLVSGRQEVDIALANGQVQGSVLEEAGPVVGAKVHLIPRTGDQETSSRSRGVMIASFGNGTTGPVFETLTFQAGQTSTTTGEDGSFRFEEVPAGKYQITVESTAHTAHETDVFPHDGIENHDAGSIYLEAAGAIQGKVLGMEMPDLGEAFTLVMVRLLDKDGKELDSVPANPDGSYRFKNVKPGTYRIETGPDRRSGEIKVLAGETTQYDLPAGS
ncbi:MAG: hypothetical protein DWQ01_07410 [Planctomycetota bacterium]|nr:MAG: hypothetical protein DWQ01_07410 [Planctomycetota bacterium]